MREARWGWVWCIAAFTTHSLAAGPAAPALAPLVSGDHINPPWHVVGLPRQSKPYTRFAAESVDGRTALRVEADKSYGNLVHELHEPAASLHLHWQWRLQQGNAAADLHRRAGDDTPLKVCVSFELPLDAVPFGERQLLRLARASSGEQLPAATLCYVWSHAEAHGARIDSAFTRRLRYVVLRNAGDAAGTWFEETRDIAADFRQSFGDESAQAPPLVAVIVGADADNTGAHTVGHVEGLRLQP